MSQTPAALYARVSSEQQADAGTIRSQAAEILERARVDGVDVAEEFRFCPCRRTLFARSC